MAGLLGAAAPLLNEGEIVHAVAASLEEIAATDNIEIMASGRVSSPAPAALSERPSARNRREGVILAAGGGTGPHCWRQTS